ncbi:MAG: YtxH domain-containing protein [Chloroflexi bacterium]|nr:YtxH domain-containing protein [Chloroflexota bacterium]
MNNDRVYYSHDAEKQAMRAKTLLTLLCLAFGLGMGAALALLFAPSSGKTARHDLARGVEDGLNSGRETVEPLVKRLEEEFADLRKNINERLTQS